MTSGMMMSTTLYLLLDLSSWHMDTGVVTSRSLGVGAGPGGACGLRWWAQVLPVPCYLPDVNL